MSKAPPKAPAKAKTEAAAPDSAEAPKKKPPLVPILLLVGGLALGGGGASAYFLMFAPKPAAATPEHAAETGEHAAEPEEHAEKRGGHGDKAEEPSFVELERLTVPLVGENGKLSTYVTMEVSLEVAHGKDGFVKGRMPIIRAAVNEGFSVAKLASPHEPRQIDFAKAERLMAELANKALEEESILSAHIISAMPI